MSDLISRQAAIEVLTKTSGIRGDALKALYDLPSVTPKPKTDVLDKARAEIGMYEADCRLSGDEYPSCKECTDNVFESIYRIIDKYKTESEVV